MGNLNFSLGKVQYDNLSLSTFPLEAQIGVGVGASIVALIVLIIVLIYRSVRVRSQAPQLFSHPDYSVFQVSLGLDSFPVCPTSTSFPLIIVTDI